MKNQLPAKVLKLLGAALVATPVAIVISIVGSCYYYLSMANPSCNCYAEKMGMARVAFEANYQLTYLVIFAVAVVLTALLYLLPWSRWRLVLLLVAAFAGYIAWDQYPSYYAQIASTSERWWPHPVTSVSAAVFSDIARDQIAPLLKWQSGCALAAGGGVYLIGELVSGAIGMMRFFAAKKANEGAENLNLSAG